MDWTAQTSSLSSLNTVFSGARDFAGESGDKNLSTTFPTPSLLWEFRNILTYPDLNCLIVPLNFIDTVNIRNVQILSTAVTTDSHGLDKTLVDFDMAVLTEISTTTKYPFQIVLPYDIAGVSDLFVLRTKGVATLGEVLNGSCSFVGKEAVFNAFVDTANVNDEFHCSVTLWHVGL